MQVWDAFTHTGNQEFNDGNFEFALTHYEKALKQSCDLLHKKNEDNYEPIVNQILISHCNLANCYFELNWIKKACEQFEIAHQFLKSAIVLSDCNHLQIAALKANRLLKNKWLTSLRKYQNQLPDMQVLRSYSKSMCLAYNIHSFKQLGVKNEFNHEFFLRHSFNY